MSRYLLDTDTLTLLEHNHPGVIAQVTGQPSAAVALANGLIVVTRNRRDFGRIPNLGVVDWSI